MEQNLAFSTKITQVFTVLKYCALCGKLFKTINLQNHMRIHMNNAYMKYFLGHILTIGFQFWEPLRSGLYINLDLLILTPLLNPLLVIQT